MYVFAQKNMHVVWGQQWCSLTSGISLRTDFYMTQKDQVFIADVVVTNLKWETMALNVISQLEGAMVKLNAIAKIRKYRGLHEGHYFILMAMEVHGAPGCDMDHFIRECDCLFHNRRLKGHLSLSFLCLIFQAAC
jgi:hypothetical protein